MEQQQRRAVVVTVSDGVDAGAREDASGAALAERLVEAGWSVGERLVVPDEVGRIGAVLRAAAQAGANLVVTTGGTGLGPRDVTPEATRAVMERPVPGLAEAMRAAGRASTPMADLSRGEVVALGSTLVVNTPGSVRGAVESLDAVLELLPHAVQLLAGDTRDHPEGHGTGSVPHSGEGPGEHGGASATAASASGASPSGGPHDHDAGDAHDHGHAHDDACALAHAPGIPDERRPGTLVAVYASPVAATLLDWGRGLGYRRVVLVEPDPALEDRIKDDAATAARHARTHADVVVTSVGDAGIDDDSDVVITDHGREALTELCEELLRSDARWIGLMGSPRHSGPHVEPLTERGWSEDDVARIQRPIGLDIGSKTPPEIALSTLAGLVADRQDRSGGFYAPA